MAVKLLSSSGGSVTLDVGVTASNFALTVPTANGTVITTGSTGQVIPTAALPAGSVLQVVNARSSSLVSTNSSATILTLTITPTTSSSRIFVIGNCTIATTAGSNAYGVLTILKNGNNLTQTYSGFNSSIFTIIPNTTSTVDTTGSTATITYTLRLGTGSGGTSSVSTADELYSLTAMEIA